VVERDRLGRVLSVALLMAEVGVILADGGFVGDDEWFKWDDICCSDGRRAIRGLGVRDVIEIEETLTVWALRC
jgi:hypothetical protein